MNININLNMCEGNILLPSILQEYILKWFHTYLLRPVMDGMEAIIHQQFFWTRIIKSVHKEVNYCDTYQHTKRSNEKHGRLPDKEAEWIPRKKLYVDIIGLYIIWRKLQNENLILKDFTTIHPVTGWFKIMQYDNKCAISIVKLIETTWMVRYPRPMEIMYDQVSEFIIHKLRKPLIETEYGILSKPSNLGSPSYNSIF